MHLSVAYSSASAKAGFPRRSPTVEAELTKQNVGVVVIREGINTADGSAASKLLRKMMLDRGDFEVKSTSERI